MNMHEYAQNLLGRKNKLRAIKRTFSSIVWLNYLILLTIRHVPESFAFSPVSFGWFWKEPVAVEYRNWLWKEPLSYSRYLNWWPLPLHMPGKRLRKT